VADEVIEFRRVAIDPTATPTAETPAGIDPGHATPAEDAPADPQPKTPAGTPPLAGPGAGAPSVGFPGGGLAAGVPQTPSGRPGAGDEQRIAQLEARLAQLLELLERRGIAEVNGLRAPDAPLQPGDKQGGTNVPRMGMPGTTPGKMGSSSLGEGVMMPSADGKSARWYWKSGEPAKWYYKAVDPLGPSGDAVVETLTRARYKLPVETAQPTAEFIRQYVTADVDVSVEGETLTVTAKQDDQARVAAFIELLRQRDDDHRQRPQAENKPAVGR
jgi:hypothetical protein